MANSIIIKGNCKICNKKLSYKQVYDFDYSIFSDSEQMFPPTKHSQVHRIGFGKSIAVCIKCWGKYRKDFEKKGNEFFNKLLQKYEQNKKILRR